MAAETPNLSALTVHGGPVLTSLGIISRIPGGVVHDVKPRLTVTHDSRRNEQLFADVDIFREYDFRVEVTWESRSRAAFMATYAPGTKLDGVSLPIIDATVSQGYDMTLAGLNVLLIKNDRDMKRGELDMFAQEFAFRRYNPAAVLS